MDRNKLKQIADEMGLIVHFDGPAGILDMETNNFMSIDEIFPEFSNLYSVENKLMETSQEILLSESKSANEYGKNSASYNYGNMGNISLDFSSNNLGAAA